MKIKKNDQVKILAGKDRGKTGKVLRVLATEDKIIVEGLNIVKKHVKARKEGESGQRIEIPGKINVSNTMLVCPKCGKATRIGYKVTGKDKMRVCKQCKAEV
ncbi:MAG: Ribosomal protein L24 [Candidatus Moranbacteria bacterium GW2011_GWA2_39_41]|nr:MAG: Ribosomal protein L24 [Candidatus Moranbacteria bacterium GW2011_GWA2_39_41]